MVYTCLIVEDEPLAAEILQSFLEKDSELSLLTICSDAFQANTLLKERKIDLLFLDLNLPIIKGFDFLRKLTDPPKVIVTTAHHEFALEGFALDVVDYLLKPIAITRFQEAIQKFKYLEKAKIALMEYLDRDYIYVQIGKKQIKIILNEIWFIESFREYCTIHTKKESITIKMPLSKMEELLDSNCFLRIHKSFIVATDKISSYTTNQVVINEKIIPIGRTFKPELAFLKKI